MDGKLSIIEDVPARACENCGEKYFSAKVSKQIDTPPHTFLEFCDIFFYLPEDIEILMGNEQKIGFTSPPFPRGFHHPLEFDASL